MLIAITIVVNDNFSCFIQRRNTLLKLIDFLAVTEVAC